jgi:hypothetical protein
VKSVICPYCQKAAEKVHGQIVYPHRPDLREKTFYLCRPCEAWVGCHPHTDTPLGQPANEETRRARSAAHLAFDPLWQYGGMDRNHAYSWLAKAIEVPREKCHIGMMTAEQCRLVVEAVKAL